jgi:MerR family transcriptional regulator, copper efflux regulator
VLIKELSQKVGLSTHTIRFYEKKKLITERYIQRGTNNYRQYSQDTVERILQIKTLHEVGFTLSEIRNFFDKWDSGELTPKDGEYLLQQKLKEIDAKIMELKRIKINFISKLGVHIKQAANKIKPK